MGRFVNPDNSAFQVALNSKIYIDKTGLIEYTNSVLDTSDALICNSRPRRFGKSYAANMLAAYYSKGADSKEMFSELEISKDEDFRKHLNKYDVIHMDIQLPKMDGWEATRVIRKMKREDSDLPILAMSANAFLEDRRKSLESGMNGHISKPVDYDEVRRIIGEQLCAVRSH